MFTTFIDPPALLPHLDDPNWLVVDCRFKLEEVEAGRRAYLEAHIAGAIYAHLDHDLSGPKTGRNGRHPLPDSDSLRRALGAMGISESTQVIAYDDMNGGLAAARLWWLLRFMGHRSAAVLNGSWQSWVAARNPVRSGEESRGAAQFIGHPHPAMIVDADSVSSLAASPDWAIIDSRAAARYRGDEEPLDPIAGHIPGARNYDWQNNFDSGGRLLPADQLRQQMQKILGGAPPEQAVYYCGSGVTSAFNVLVMEAVGLPGAKLYPGSWSEWCSDPARPIATGDKP
ncbi:MAG: sulfurtransferase [Chloroflexota bacterium]